MFKKLIYITILIIFSQIVLAATIQGTIYDIELNPVKNARIEVDSTPKQLLISKDGTYSFNLEKGTYTLKAGFTNLETLSAIETITIKDQGTYKLDLILFPELEDILDDEFDIEPPFEEKPNLTLYIVAIIVIIIVIFLIIKLRKKPKKEIPEKEEEIKKEIDDEELEKVVDFIKKQDNRTTQKDIRKHLGLSEAKISLMIADLESQGKIKKIKKGRGNIIILKH